MADTKEYGRVTRGVGGLYEVLLSDGRVRRCRAAGKLHRDDGKLLVGDAVTLSMADNGREEAVIDEIAPRRCALIRPPLANVTHMVLAASGAYPAPATATLDRMLAICESACVTPVLAVTKNDLCPDEAAALASLYRGVGYPTFLLSSVTGEGVQELRTYLTEALSEGGICAFAGASGVGKSTLLTALFPSLALETGTLSDKTARGRHTTRRVELFPFGGGFVADTPGFSLLDFEHFDFFSLEELASCFPDFSPYVGGCRYDDCTHTKEEGCALLAAVAAGKVAKSRHESYLELYPILKAKKNSYGKKSGRS